MIASDAWVSTQVAKSLANITADLQDFCNASDTAITNWVDGIGTSFLSSFEMNLAFSAVFGIGETISAFKTAYGWARSAVDGAWNKAFTEGDLVINDPPSQPIRVGSDGSPQSGGNRPASGDQNGGGQSINSGQKVDSQPQSLNDLNGEASALLKSLQDAGDAP